MNWAYIAGFFDGEGHVSRRIHNSSAYYAEVTQRLTKREVIDIIAAFLKERDIPTTFAIKPPCLSHPQGQIYLFVRGYRNILNFLPPMLPFLIVKHDEAVSMISACEGALAREIARKDRLSRAVDAYVSGMNLNDIRKQFGVGWRPASRTLRNLGIHIRTRGDMARARRDRLRPTTLLEQCATEYIGGASLAHLVKSRGVGERYLRAHLLALGVLRDSRTAAKLFWKTAPSEWLDARKEDILRGGKLSLEKRKAKALLQKRENTI